MAEEASGANRRETKREAILGETYFRILKPGLSNEAHECFIVDISEGGVQIISTVNLEVGDFIEILIHIAADVIKARAAVRRIISFGNRYGCQFLDKDYRRTFKIIDLMNSAKK